LRDAVTLLPHDTTRIALGAPLACLKYGSLDSGRIRRGGKGGDGGCEGAECTQLAGQVSVSGAM
jgi:hypothetical protein